MLTFLRKSSHLLRFMTAHFLVVVLVAVSYGTAGCGSADQQRTGVPDAPSAAPRSELAIRTFCADCHAFPEPDTYPRHVWPEKVQEGFRFYFSSLRTDLTVPAVDAVEEYYHRRAPEVLEIDIGLASADSVTGASCFSGPQQVASTFRTKAVAHLRSVVDDSGRGMALLLSDMRTGQLWSLPPESEDGMPQKLAQCMNACHVEPTDLNGDSETDYVVADLGSFLPEDHANGAIWFVSQDSDGNWSAVPLIEGLGRVADVRPLDADSDGDIDLVVAEFGWHATGSILLLRNDPTPDGSPRMTPEVLDPRHGTIHVPVVDLNADGHPDFVALISQEFEVVEAFLNRGDGTFQRKPLFEAGNPGFGSSGIELADIDGDEDVDIAYVNGDSLDTPIAKPYHSVMWLENRGDLQFTPHEICKLPGGYCVRAADADQDGDIDLAVVTLVPSEALNAHPEGTFGSVVWLEQTTTGQFTRHSLERDNCQHAACEWMDWDGDGDLDLLVADMAADPNAERSLSVFQNRTIDENTTSNENE